MTIEALAASDGAFTIGGGEWNYGQNMTEELGKSLFMLPELTPENIMTILRLALERLPLDALKAFQPAMGLAAELFNDVGTAVTTIIENLLDRPIMQTVIEFTDWVNETFQPLRDLFDSLVAILSGNFSAVPAALSGVNTWLQNLVESIPVLSEIVHAITGVVNGTLTDLTEWANGIATDISDNIKGLIHALTGVLNGDFSDVQEWVSNLGTLIFDGIKGVIFAITGIVNGTLEDLAEWVTTIPIIGDIVEAIMGIPGTLADLATWFANNVLTMLSKLPAWNLIGQIPAAVMGVLNIGHLTTEPVNLLLHPTLEDATTVSAVDGWSWDSTQNASGTGGSAKVTLDGFNKELSHQTSVQVAPGDKMTLSASVKTSGVTGTGWKVGVTVMEYRNGAIATPVEVASRTTAASSWVNIVGDYVVPANVTSVVFRLVVENGTAGTVWFDNLDMHKSGVLEQGWVENLPNAWENIWGGLVGTSGIGKTWSDMTDAGTNVRTRAATAQGGADAANGNLQTTWNSFYDAHSGAAGSTGQTPSSAAAAANTHRVVSYGAAGTASTADGKATTATGNIQDTWNKMYEAVFGGSATGKTSTDVKTAINTTATTATGAASAASTADGKAVAAQSSATTASTAATTAGNKADNTNIKLFGTATPATGATIQSNVLPASVTTVGSGVAVQRTNAAGAYTTTFNGNGVIVPWGFYNVGGLTTSDITVSNVGGYTCAKVSNAGWYLVEVNYQLRGAGDLANYSYHWGLTPVIFKASGTTVPSVPFKWGNTGTCVVDTFAGGTNSWTSAFCSGNFIVYLEANETIFPGYFWSREGSATSDTIIISTTTTGSYGTYFSMSLLNRSLA